MSDKKYPRKSQNKFSQSSSYDLCIVGGAGRVGLPLGVVFANHQVKTVLCDINKVSLEKISRGKFPFLEKDGDEQLKKALRNKMLFMSDSPAVISQSKYVLVVIGTPVDKYLNPDFNSFMSVIEQYLDYFKDGQILILRSTIYPGVSEKVQNLFINKKKKVGVAFCPERIVEGVALEELKNLPQIISAFDTRTLIETEQLFKKIVKSKIIKLDPLEAELAKLFSNAWRYIKFSVANQFLMIAEDYNLDYFKIDQAMKDGYPRNKELPSPGFAAGPCLFKDTMQLSAFNKNNFFVGHAAMLINEGLPNFLIQKLKKEHDLTQKTIGILGMTFKAESDDVRDSLSFKLKKIAEMESKKVLYHDFYLKSMGDPAFVGLGNLLGRSDIIILATPHEGYKKIDFSKYQGKTIIDIWGFWK